MKKDIRPQSTGQVVATCACGATFMVGSTKDSITTEICSNCHLFFTGKQKLVDTAGRVDKFRAKQAKAEEKKAAAKKDEDTEEETTTEETPVVEETPAVEEEAKTEEEAPEVEEETPAEEETPEEELKEAA